MDDELEQDNIFFARLLGVVCEAVEGMLDKVDKEEVTTILKNLPDDCSIEDIQYHLFVVEKIRNGIARAENDNTISQEDVQKKFSKWILQ